MNEQLLQELTQEAADTGVLCLPSRRRLWEALGPLEPREQDSSVPRSLTPPLKRRAELALACAKKVTRIWCAFDSEDKRPQQLIRQTRAYLDGKLSAGDLQAGSGVIEDFMSIVDEAGCDSATAAAIAAWKALVVALEDEGLLEPWCAGVTDASIDSYDWDTAKNAAMAWRDAHTGGDKGKQAVRELKFWAWYLEEAAKLLDVEGYRFPPKYIKAFAEKQDPPRPVPEEVTLESFAAYLGGTYYYHTYLPPQDGDDTGAFNFYIRYEGDSGVCPKCGKATGQLDMIWRDCCLWEISLPGKRELDVVRVMPNFHCLDHPDVLWIFPESAEQIASYKAAFDHYMKGPGRKQAFVDQLLSRLPRSLHIKGDGATIDGWGVALEKLDARKDALGLTNAGWVDQSMESYAFDVGPFLPHIYIQDCTFDEFPRRYPQRVRRLEDGSVELEVHRVWARFWLDEAGRPERVMLTARFSIWLKEDPRRQAALPLLLAENCHLTVEQAAEAICTAKGRVKDYEIVPLTGLTRPEALRLYEALTAGGIDCRILPTPISFTEHTI